MLITCTKFQSTPRNILERDFLGNSQKFQKSDFSFLQNFQERRPILWPAMFTDKSGHIQGNGQLITPKLFLQINSEI